MAPVGNTAVQIELKEATHKLRQGPREPPVFVVGPDDSITYPGLIIVHEIFGLNDHIKDVARRFARQKLRVFAPDLFAGADNLPDDRSSIDGMRQVWQSISDSQLIHDLKTVLNMASSRDDVEGAKIGTIGYCMGGAIAFMFACESPEIAWVIDYYGRVVYGELSVNKPKHPVEYSPGLKCPVLAIFSGSDPLIPDNHIQLFTSSLEKLGKSGQIKVYDRAPHGFFNDTRDCYDSEAAAEAWQLTLDFMDKISRQKV